VPITLGAPVRLAAECRTLAGELANASGVTLTITLPDGTTVSPPVTNPPAEIGLYTYDYVTEQTGRHAVYWTFTGPAGAAAEAFDVRPADPPAILSLADARAHLNITNSRHDEELRGWIETTTQCVEHFVGAVVRRTVTELHTDLPPQGARALALRGGPVIEVAGAARLDGTAVDTSGWDVDEHDLVRRRDGGRITGPVRVIYLAGRPVIPANITSAARVILQHLWRTQHPTGSGRPQLGADDYAVTEPIAGIGYAIPNRALHLLERHRNAPGVA